MSLDADAKKVLLRKIPHGLFICGVAEGDVVNGTVAGSPKARLSRRWW